MSRLVLLLGIGVQAVAWRLIALGRLAFWPTCAAVWAFVGLASVLATPPRCCEDVPLGTAFAVGAGSGVALSLATRAVVARAVSVPSLAAAVDDVYERRNEAPPAVVWAVTLLVVVPGEEVFWRGLALPELQAATGATAGAVLGWALASAVGATWGSLPFLAAAVVGGALWTALGAWSGGVVAPLASHAIWTAAMIAWRPATGRAKVPR